MDIQRTDMERKKKFQKVSDFGSNRAFSGQIWDRKRKSWFFSLASLTKGTLLSLYGAKEEKMNFFRFQLNKQHFAGLIWYGRRKIKKFLDLVMKSTVAVPIWSRKRNFFSKMEAKRRFLSLYGVKGKKAKCFCNKSSFGGLIWSERGKKWNFFINQLSKRHFPVLIWCERKKAKRFLPKRTFLFVRMV